MYGSLVTRVRGQFVALDRGSYGNFSAIHLSTVKPGITGKLLLRAFQKCILLPCSDQDYKSYTRFSERLKNDRSLHVNYMGAQKNRFDSVGCTRWATKVFTLI